MYTGSSGATMKDALKLIRLASKYDIIELSNQCSELLKGDITLESCLPLFEQSMEFGQKELIATTLNFICKY